MGDLNGPKLQVKLLKDDNNEIVVHQLTYPYMGMSSADTLGIALAPRHEVYDVSFCRYSCFQPLIGTTIGSLGSRYPVIDLDTKKIRVFLAVGDKEREARKIVVEFVN